MTDSTEREAFEAWAKEHRRDLDLRYMYDEQGQYHYDGYIWNDAADAFRIWQARAALSAQAPQPQQAPTKPESGPRIDLGRYAGTYGGYRQEGEVQATTGWPPGMLQDDSRELSQWLASKPDAPLKVREAVAQIISQRKATKEQE